MLKLSEYGYFKASKTAIRLPPHTNDGLELVYVANGAANWDYQGAQVSVPAGHLSFTWPWQLHGAVNDRVPSVELYFIVMPLKCGRSREGQPATFPIGSGLRKAEGTQLIQRLLACTPVVRVSPYFGRQMIRLVKHLMQTGGRYDVMARGLFLTLAAELSDAAERIDEKKRKEAELERVVATFWEQSLSKNLDREWTLDSMAKACQLGRTRFAEITKALYADPPMGKLARTRIEGSLQMMQTTDASVTEIAHACGFSSSQYFATVFRAFHNTPPSQAMRAIRDSR